MIARNKENLLAWAAKYGVNEAAWGRLLKKNGYQGAYRTEDWDIYVKFLGKLPGITPCPICGGPTFRNRCEQLPLHYLIYHLADAYIAVESRRTGLAITREQAIANMIGPVCEHGLHRGECRPCWDRLCRESVEAHK